jgi:ribosomal protein S18 acetylase RimI-like enzyme
MNEADYDNVYALWKSIKGFGIRSLDDSRAGITRFLNRNPHTSIIAAQGGKIVGSILCGHDGRTGAFYHVCVDPDYRKQGIGRQMVEVAMEALHREHINKVSLFAFQTNEIGNRFWKSLGWTCRQDIVYYDLPLNKENTTMFQ